ncbi:phenylacetate--CoA ligase family protein [Candidatus Giovannonibacteria bacterium]|nr:phenylacetate--CoA ligase family protein [Candidatus Giovannonibacteria bacterium]
MNNQDVLISMDDALPPTLNSFNLAGNESFLNWLLPIVESLRETEYWNKDHIAKIQSARLEKLFLQLSGNSSFWDNHFRQHDVKPNASSPIDELKKLPIINRDWFLAKKNTFVISPNIREGSLRYFSTSGTTGKVLAGAFTHGEIIVSYLPYFFRHRVFNSIGEFISRKFFLGIGRVLTEQYSSLGDSFILDHFASLEKKEIRNELYKKIKSISPAMLWAYPTTLLEFATYYRDDNIQLPLLAVRTGGEYVTKSQKDFIKVALGTEYIDHYSAREIGSIGTSCDKNPTEGFYHIDRERLIVEVLDDDGGEVPGNTEGNIIITVLDRTTFPLIRYALGDRGKIVSCVCGRTDALIFAGRVGEYILLPSGKRFSVLQFRTIIANLVSFRNIRNFRIVQESLDTLSVSIFFNYEPSSNQIDLFEKILSKTLYDEIKVSIKKVDAGFFKAGKSKVFENLKRG